MTPELIEAIGQYIVGPIVGGTVAVMFLYIIWRS